MTIDNAILLLKDEYENARKAEWVDKPVAYSLYQVWQQANREEEKALEEMLEDKIVAQADHDLRMRWK